MIVGLTGQSGAGKTTISNVFSENGFVAINCDIVARSVTDDGSKCNKQLAKYFPDCFDSNYKLDRRKMAEIVFNNTEKLEALNSTIYPYITDEIDRQAQQYKKNGENYILLDAPTLFEAGADKLCDVIISVIADTQTRIERIALRDNIPTELIISRFKSQKSTKFFTENSDYVIENNYDISQAIADTQNVIKSIKERING